MFMCILPISCIKNDIMHVSSFTALARNNSVHEIHYNCTSFHIHLVDNPSNFLLQVIDVSGFISIHQ